MHAINVCEVLYHFLRSLGPSGLSIARTEIKSAGIQEHASMDQTMVDTVAALKADIVRVSLADCCLLALAQRLGGHVLTTDRKELDAPAPLAVCPIHFIR
jgi:PIN domain nuclease of toxin-antitoxin system